jgi:hypothetical protein
MRWKKLGNIFNPAKHDLFDGCKEYAQSPQALVLDDFVRIYFSTREKVSSGKFLSHIAFAEFDKNFKIININKNKVIELGHLGCFDEHGIFPMNVVRFKEKIYAYTCGWSRRVSVSIETSIGIAISDDNGLTFIKKGNGPVLTSSLNEPFLVGDPFVSIFNNLFHMWYIYGLRWVKNEDNNIYERVYKINHATSKDGINWIREGRQIVADKLNIDECQALPTVIEFNNNYHMFFCYREATDFRTNKKRGYRIGYAYSEDLINWTRDDEKSRIDVSKDCWDSDMQCYPHAFKWNGRIYLLYNGNEFGKYGFGIAVLEK